MKRRHVLMGGTLAIAAWLALFADKTPESGLAEPVARAVKSVPRSAPKAIAPSVDSDGVLALRARSDLIGGAHQNTNEAAPGALFSSHSWEPPPPRVVMVKALPPPPPTAPPLPYTYLGKMAEEGVWEVFLARGEQTYIVRIASVIDGVYRVDAIRPPALSLTYLPLKQMQTLQIGSAE